MPEETRKKPSELLLIVGPKERQEALAFIDDRLKSLHVTELPRLQTLARMGRGRLKALQQGKDRLGDQNAPACPGPWQTLRRGDGGNGQRDHGVQSSCSGPNPTSEGDETGPSGGGWIGVRRRRRCAEQRGDRCLPDSLQPGGRGARPADSFKPVGRTLRRGSTETSGRISGTHRMVGERLGPVGELDGGAVR